MNIPTKPTKQLLPQMLRTLGVLGTVVCVILFIQRPSWPTPDKLIVFLTFVFLAIGQAKEMLKRLLPFVGLLLVYESFRGLATHLNKSVHYLFMARFDERLFGGLPTKQLQNLLWTGHAVWYDFLFYLVYMLHFIVPLALALLIWKKRDGFYWKFVAMFVVLSFMGFFTYVLYPAAPPWMSSDMGLITPVVRVSSHVWYALGIQDFPSLYNKISPNPVAAVPSLHAAYATLSALIIFKLFGKKWGLLACIYPVLMFFGIVYEGEHYVFDVLLGIVYAVASYFLVLYLFNMYHKKVAGQKKLRKKPVRTKSTNKKGILSS